MYQNKECTWCLDSNKCDYSSTRTCKSFTNDPKQCGPCSSATDCNSCTNLVRNCSWCLNGNSGKCVTSESSPKCETTIGEPNYCRH